MSCGARLPVYALFAAAFFPENGGPLVFLLYLIGIAFAVITGLALRHTLLQGEASPFVMELPPYHLPTLKAVVLHTWDRLKGFVLRAGRVIVAVVVVLNMLGSLGTDGSLGHRNTDQSVLAVVAQQLTPVFEPMGITRDNWPATVGLISGIFAKEAVVGTLNSLYGATDAGAAADGAFDPLAAVAAAAASVVDNLGGFAGAVSDPLGFGIANEATPAVSAERQGVSLGTFGAMALRFDGPVGAFAYLLAVLLYMPCVAALAAIYRETGPAWAAFATLWTSGLAYGAGVIAYQAGTFARSPGTAALWIGGVLAVFALAIAILRAIGAPRRWAAGAAPAE
jgi:ferrous iron transport protein B